MAEHEFEPMDAVTVTETELFHEHIGHPYKQLKHVYRAVVSDQTGDLAENTPISWYQRLLKGRPKGWVPIERKIVQPKALTGSILEGWQIIQDMRLHAAGEMTLDDLWACSMAEELVADTPQSINLLEWCIDVFADDPTQTATQLRRNVMRELFAEVAAVDNWQQTLQFLDWLQQRRTAQAFGTALPQWEDYSRDTPAEKAAVGGAQCLHRIIETQARNIAAMNQAPAPDTDNPLGEDGPETQIAAAGV